MISDPKQALYELFIRLAVSLASVSFSFLLGTIARGVVHERGRSESAITFAWMVLGPALSLIVMYAMFGF